MLFSAPKVLIKPFSRELTLRSASDATSRSTIPSALQSSLGKASKLLPYSLLLTNNTGSTIIGYTIHYSGDSEGSESFAFNRVFYNFGVKSNGIEIPAGATQLATPLNAYTLHAPSLHTLSTTNGGPDEADKWLSSIAGQPVLILSVDLVVLDSGKVLGPNDGGTLEGLEGFLSGQAEAISIVRSSLARKLSTEDIAAELSRKFDEERVKSTRTAMTRAAEFRKFASFARRSRNLLLNELAKVEENFRSISLTR
jgi:hypothetical protein